MSKHLTSPNPLLDSINNKKTIDNPLTPQISLTGPNLAEDATPEELASKSWRMNHLYHITDKQGNFILFKPNKAQLHFLQNKSFFNIICKSRQLGFCLDPETKILTADLRWIKIKDLIPGQEIIGVDEFPQDGRGCGRKMRTAEVKAVVKVRRKAYKITFDDGRSVVCTAQHPWLSRKASTDLNWGTIELNKSKDKKRRNVHLQVGTKVRYITKPWGESNFEDGWFGGMLDGEGSMNKNPRTPAKICVCQKRGPVFERLQKYVKDRGYNYTIESDIKKPIRDNKFGQFPCPKINIGRMNEMFKLLGQTRPERFKNNRFWEGRELPGKRTTEPCMATIIKIEELGEQEMIDLQTSTGTYIAEGFVSHNTTLAVIDMLDNILFRTNFHAMLISYDDDSAKDLFQKKVQFAWEHLPKLLKDKYQVDSSRSNLLRLNHGNENYSDFKIDNTGRSGTYQHVHISEFAKIAAKFPEKVDDIIRGTFPAVHPPYGQITIESTSEGPTGQFYEMFMEAYQLPKNHVYHPKEFKAFFYNWQWDQPAIEDLSPDRTLNPEVPREFLDIQKKHNEQALKYPELNLRELTDQQLNFYYYLWLSQGKSWKKLLMEYPLTPEDAFRSSSKNIFDIDNILKLKQKAKDISPQERRGWLFYDEIKANHHYVIGADPAEGTGGDSTAATIIDFSTRIPKLVATFQDRNTPPDIFAYELRTMGEMCNLALIMVERNNHGHATLNTLKGIYPIDYIYKEVRTSHEDDEETFNLGWHTNLATKPRMFYELATALNDNLIEIPSYQVLKELGEIDRAELGKIRIKGDDETSKHFDLSSSLAIAYQGRTQIEERTVQPQVISTSSKSDLYSVI